LTQHLTVEAYYIIYLCSLALCQLIFNFVVRTYDFSATEVSTKNGLFRTWD